MVPEGVRKEFCYLPLKTYSLFSDISKNNFNCFKTINYLFRVERYIVFNANSF